MILALDQGTTSSRAILFDRGGSVAGSAQTELRADFPQAGWVEQDANEIWSTQLRTAQEALRNASASAKDVTAIGITNQRETTILWERASGRPVANAIVCWQDRRTASICEAHRARGAAPLVSERTGLVLDPYFSATKIAWLLDHIGGLRVRAERGEIAFGTVDSWLVWQLTGGKRHVTDVTNASRTMLYDIHRARWIEELLELFGVPAQVLPEVLPCTADFGVTAPGFFDCAIPVAGVAGDQQAALIGQGGFESGIAKSTYGTGSFVVLNTGAQAVRSTHGLVTTLAFALGREQPAYALEGSVFVTGAAVQWLRDGLGFFAESADVQNLARSVPDTGGVSFVPAFTGLGAPYWDPHARGAILGLTRGTTRAHIARAALEAMALQTCDVVAAMERDAGLRLSELRVDGGASVNDLAMQMQADLLGIDIVRPAVTQTTALGAAYLAGLQCGFWPSVKALEQQWREAARFTPSIGAAERSQRLAQWHDAVARTRVQDA